MSLADDSSHDHRSTGFLRGIVRARAGRQYYFSYSTTLSRHSARTSTTWSATIPMTGFEYAGTILHNPGGNNYNNNHHSIVEYEGAWYSSITIACWRIETATRTINAVSRWTT